MEEHILRRLIKHRRKLNFLRDAQIEKKKKQISWKESISNRTERHSPCHVFT